MKSIMILTKAAGVKKGNRKHLATRKNHTQGKATAKPKLVALHLKNMKSGNGVVAAIHTKSGPEAAAEAEAKVPIMVMTFGAAAQNRVLHGTLLVDIMTVGAATKNSVRAWPVTIMTVVLHGVALVALLRAWPVNLREKMFGDTRNDTSTTPIGFIMQWASLAADTILLDVILLDISLLLLDDVGLRIRSSPDIDVVLLPMPRAASQVGERDNQAVGPPHPYQNKDIGAITTLLATRCGCQTTNEAA